MSVDKQLLTRKGSLIKRDLDGLKKYTKMSQLNYLDNYEVQLQVERLLERIIGRLIDVNFHILKEGFGVVPVDYTESFILMGKNKVVKMGLAEKIRPAGGLRNMLAHEYDEIDSKQVYKGMRNVVRLVPLYLTAVLNSF